MYAEEENFCIQCMQKVEKYLKINRKFLWSTRTDVSFLVTLITKAGQCITQFSLMFNCWS